MWRICQIVSFASHFQLEALAHGKGTEQRQIVVVQMRTANGVPSGVAEAVWPGHRKREWRYPGLARTNATEDDKRSSHIGVIGVARTITRRRIRYWRERSTRSIAINAVQLPSAQDCRRFAAASQKWLPSSEWGFQHVTNGQQMSLVKVRRPVLT